MPTVPCRLCKWDKFFTRQRAYLSDKPLGVQFLDAQKSFDVCRQNVFRASVSSFVADVEVSRRLDRRNGKCEFVVFAKHAKTIFAVAVFVKRKR